MVVVQPLGQGWGVQPQQLQQPKQPHQPQPQPAAAASSGTPSPSSKTRLPLPLPPTGTPKTTNVGAPIFLTLGRVAAAGSSPATANPEQQFVFAVPTRKQVAAVAVPPSTMVEWRNTFNVRPVLLSTLRSRRNGVRHSHSGHGGHAGLRGGVAAGGPGGPPSRVGSARSLDLLRTNLQSAINKDIKEVLNKYMERFFLPAMDNIRVNMGMSRGCEMLGSEVLLEDQVRAVLQRALEEAKLMYSRPSASTAPLHQQQQQQEQQQGRRQRKRSRTRAASAPAVEQVKQTPVLAATPGAPGACAAPGASPPVAVPSAPGTPTNPIAVPVVKFHNGVLTHSSRATTPTALTIGGDKSPPPATLQQMYKKRKEMDAEAETRRKKARLATILVTSGGVAQAGPGALSAMPSGAVAGAVAGAGGAVTILTVPQGRPNSPRASPSPSLSPRPSPSASPANITPPKQNSNGMAAPTGTATASLGHVHINYQSPKWDPARITPDTLFVVGARANKVLGYESSRGRMYNRHQDLFKYASDHEDKEWLAKNQLIQPSGGKTFLCVMQDIHELAVSQEYKNNPNVNLLELKGFRAPDFLLKKIRAYMRNLRMEPLDDLSGLLDMDLLQEDGVANMDDSSLMELALEYGVTLMSDDTSSPTASPAAATSPVSPAACTAAVTSTNTTTSSSHSPPSTAVAALDTATTRAPVLSSETMLTTLPPPLALASLPTTTTAATAATAAPTTATPTASTAVTAAAAAAASSTPASPAAAERVKGLIRSQSLPVAPFMMESLALEELEMYIKSHSVDVEDAAETDALVDGEADGALDASLEASLEANLDANLDLNLDVNLDVGSAEHNQLELAWDFIGELSSPPHSPDSPPSAQDVEDRDEQTEDFPAEAATPAEAALASPAVPVRTSAAPSSESITAGTSSGAGGRDTTAEPEPETSLAMSHATLTALLSGNTLEGLDIPEGLL